MIRRGRMTGCSGIHAHSLPATCYFSRVQRSRYDAVGVLLRSRSVFACVSFYFVLVVVFILHSLDGHLMEHSLIMHGYAAKN